MLRLSFVYMPNGSKTDNVFDFRPVQQVALMCALEITNQREQGKRTEINDIGEKFV